MSIQTLSAQEVRQKLAAGAALIDVRGAAEYAREHIDGAVNVPLDKLAAQSLPAVDTLVFHCQSGMRTAQNAATLKQAAQGKSAYILDRGIQGWKAGGLAGVVGRIGRLAGVAVVVFVVRHGGRRFAVGRIDRILRYGTFTYPHAVEPKPAPTSKIKLKRAVS